MAYPLGLSGSGETLMAQYQEAAIILKSRPYRESDSLLTLFGQTHGKTGAIAKGVRKPKSKLQAGLFPLSYVMVELYQGRASMVTVMGADIVQGFGRMRGDLTALSWGMVLADIVDGLWSDHDASPETFQWLIVGFEALSQGKDPATVGMTVAWRCLEIAGYAPEWGHCRDCGQAIGHSGPIALSVQEGQAQCKDCASAKDGFTISLGSFKTWQQWMTLNPSRLGAIEAHGVVYRELFDLLDRYVVAQVGRRPRSLSFIQSLVTLSNEE